MCTMGVGDEHFLDLAHFHRALLYSVLGAFTAIEKPDSTSQVQGQGGVVAGFGGLS